MTPTLNTKRGPGDTKPVGVAPSAKPSVWRLNLAKTPAGAPGKYIHGSPRSNPVPLGCCRDRKA